MVTPCKDCKERHESCHSTCDTYKQWRADFDDVKRKITKVKIANADADARQQKAIERFRKSR